MSQPPSPAEIDAWLDNERALKRPPATAKAGQGSGFAMDANTGKLIPVGADLSQVCFAAMSVHAEAIPAAVC